MKKIFLFIASIVLLSFLGTGVFAQNIELPKPGITPNSPFYFLDRIAEKVQEFITFNPESKARLQVSFANERIAEIKVMLETKEVKAKGLEIAQTLLQKHAKKAADIVENEKNKGKDVKKFAEEIADSFYLQKQAAKQVFDDAKDKFQAEKNQLHEQLLEVIKTGDTVLQEQIRADIATKETQKDEVEAKKDEAIEAFEQEKDRLQDELEEKKQQEDEARDQAEEAEDIKKEIREKQQKQREKIDEAQTIMDKCIEQVYGEGEIVSSPEKDLAVKKCVKSYTIEIPIEEPPLLPEEQEQQEYHGPRIDKEGVMELMSQEGFVGPGGCGSFQECDAYCKSPGRMEECMIFIIERGLVKINLIEMNNEKINEFMGQEGFIGPGGCGSLQECDVYCKISENGKECIAFMDEYGFIPHEEQPSEEPPPEEPPVIDPIMEKCIKQIYGEGEIISTPEKDLAVKKCVVAHEKETECLSLGEGINPSLGPEYSNLGKECCEGLKLIQTEDQFDENCNPILLIGAGSICALCGNGVCEDLESRCNCPEDCKINLPPKFTSLPIFPELINIAQSIPFTWNAIDHNNDDLAWSINWGDGHNTESLCPETPSSKQKDWNFEASHAWEKAGIYMITATVKDCKGGVNSASINVKVGIVGEEIKPVIVIFSPNGGENLQTGHTYDITWESTLPVVGNSEGNEKANIYLQRGPMSETQCTLSGICCSICGNWKKIASAVPTSDNKYSWTIPDNEVTGKEYKIRIRTINNSCFDNTCLADQSDDYFSIE